MLETEQDFRERLQSQSHEKRMRSIEASRKRREEMAAMAKKRQQYAMTEFLKQILEQLNKLQMMIKLKQPQQPDVSPVKFVVNERDDDGNIKAFTVER